MLFIYGTDAPLYHYPITTSAMVSINVFVHLLVSQGEIDVSPWILSFGDGLHPLQWLTHNFVHVGWLHLIGNMLFLFPFGLLIEGKIGWWRMLLLLVAIGMCQGLCQQSLMLPHDQTDAATRLVDMFDHPDDPLTDEHRAELVEQWRKDLLVGGEGAMGSTPILFGLLAICALWAPQNEFDVWYFRGGPDGALCEWSVLAVCLMFVAKEICQFCILTTAIHVEALQLIGFVIGGFLGVAMLQFGLVDCEGHDLISMYLGSRFKSKRVIRREKRERQAELDAMEPEGPPDADLPKMPHVLLQENAMPTAPVLPKPEPIKPRPSVPFVIPPSQPDSREKPLPEFDDGTGKLDPLSEATLRIESLLAQREFLNAYEKWCDTRNTHPDFCMSPISIGRMAEGLVEDERIKSATAVMEIGIESHPAFAPRWQLRIASLELQVNQDPLQAIRWLQKIDKSMLDSSLRAQYVKLGGIARDMARE